MFASEWTPFKPSADRSVRHASPAKYGPEACQKVDYVLAAGNSSIACWLKPRNAAHAAVLLLQPVMLDEYVCLSFAQRFAQRGRTCPH